MASVYDFYGIPRQRGSDPGRALMTLQLGVSDSHYRCKDARFPIRMNTVGYPLFLDLPVSKHISRSGAVGNSTREEATPLTVAGLNCTLKKITKGKIIHKPDDFDERLKEEDKSQILWYGKVPTSYSSFYWKEKVLDEFPYIGVSGHMNSSMQGGNGINMLDVFTTTSEHVKDYWSYVMKKLESPSRTDKINHRHLYSFSPKNHSDVDLSEEKRKQYAYTNFNHEVRINIGDVLGFSLVIAEESKNEDERANKKMKMGHGEDDGASDDEPESIDAILENFNRRKETKSTGKVKYIDNHNDKYFQFVPTICRNDRTILDNGSFVKIGVATTTKTPLSDNSRRIFDDVALEASFTSTIQVNLVS